MSTIKDYDCCPHCGSDEGYYTKERAQGTIIYRRNYDGSEYENGDMYSCVSGAKGTGKWAYCLNCDKKIALMEEGAGE